jgi:glycosyltransferase involved in cell wall biosynthesis
MKVLYVTTYDSSDVNQWSGLGYYIRKAIEAQGFDVHPFHVAGEYSVTARAKRRLYGLAGRGYLIEREPSLVKKWSRQVEQAAKSMRPDVIFSPGTTPVAFVNTHHPLVIYGDATFDGLLDVFPWYSNLSNETKKKGRMIEQQAMNNCSLAIFASEWAATTAQDYYKAPNVSVVPFGANIECARSADEVEGLIESRPSNECRMLFAGVDWKNKGGDYALSVVSELNRRGLKTTLDILGCIPPSEPPPFAKVHGFVSKRTEEGRRRIDELFARAHFLILPTLADCYGVVFCEASSFGVPSLTNAVAGTTTPVKSGRNGISFSLDAEPGEWCDAILGVLANYREFALASFAEYESRLNWNVSGKQLKPLLEKL